MSLGTALTAGRRAAESLMTLTLVAYAPDGTTTDADGYEHPGYRDEGTTPGRVQGATQRGDTNARYISVGGLDRPIITSGLQIPLGRFVYDGALQITASEERGLGWEFEVTSTGPHDDPALLGRRYLVVDVPVKSHATMRRLDVVEVS